MDPKVTVLITSYNPGYYLQDAIESVLKQTYKNWEIILVDDASTDYSLNSIETYLKDPRITLVVNSTNIGQAKSLNRGLSLVKTPYVIQLDADDWFDPNTLEVLVNLAKKNPETTAVFSGNMKIHYEDFHGNVIKTRIRKGRFFKNRYDFLLANTSVWPRFYRTKALRKVGGWPTNGPYEGRYIEDLKILLRLITKYRFYWIDKTLYNHRKHATNQTKQIPQMRETLDWLIRDTLVRWGDQYTPIFKDTKKGNKKLVKLIRKKRNTRNTR